MKLAVVIGHNSQAEGAWAVAPLGRSEFDFNTEVAQEMVHMAGQYGLKVKAFERQGGVGYSTEIARVYKQVDDWGADASIELHFNSYRYTSTGCETLSSGSKGSLKLAKAVQAAMLDRLGLRDRGVKVKKRSDRGGRSLHAGRCPAILVEPFFGSNRDDCAVAASVGVVGFAKMYLAGVESYAG